MFFGMFSHRILWKMFSSHFDELIFSSWVAWPALPNTALDETETDRPMSFIARDQSLIMWVAGSDMKLLWEFLFTHRTQSDFHPKRTSLWRQVKKSKVYTPKLAVSVFSSMELQYPETNIEPETPKGISSSKMFAETFRFPPHRPCGDQTKQTSPDAPEWDGNIYGHRNGHIFTRGNGEQ